jgi:tetratricopeptide (TPR) repeat protein
MDAIGEQAAGSQAGAAWLATLPRAVVRRAQAALATLPRDAASAGSGLPEAIAAWTVAAPEVAAELLEAWLAAADAAGNLSPACPVACQWAEHVAGALPDPEKFLTRILPQLARIVTREFDRYDAQGTGLPVWHAREEALFPAEFAPGRFTADLAALLSNEAAAFARLAAGHPDLDRALGEAEGEQRELDAWLMDDFWDEEAAAFHRRDAGEASRPDESPAGWLPLVWEARTDAMVEALRPRAVAADVAAWPMRTRILVLALLLRTPHASLVAHLRRMPPAPGVTPAEFAAWTVLTLGAEDVRAKYHGEVPASARWLDAHGRALAIGVLAAALAAVTILLVWWVLHREQMAAGDLADQERRARQACAEGRHDRAAALYGQAARRADERYFRYRQAGEWMHLARYAEAERLYRALLADKADAPNVQFNLALAVLRQGRRAEALELYRALAAKPAAAAHPEIAARAALAVQLLEQQLALDRP